MTKYREILRLKSLGFSERNIAQSYLIPEGIEDYSYTKDGKEIKGSQYKVKLEFAKRSK